MTDLHTDDVPFGMIPLGERTLFQEARLDLVIVEVRFSSRTGVISDDSAEAFHELLGSWAPAFNQVAQATQQEVQLQLSASGQNSAVSETQGWEFGDADGRSLFLWPSSLAVQIAGPAYERWSQSIRPALAAGLQAVQEILRPTMMQRIGLRYINRLTAPASDKDPWSSRITPALLGPLRHEVFGSMVTTAQQQFQLQLESGRGAVIRHGLHPLSHDGREYLIDIDVFDLVATKFSPEQLLGSAQRANRTAMALFQQCVTHKMQEEMKPIRTGADS